jgi:hypothetical protein
MTDEIKDGVYASVSGTVGRVADGRFTIEVQNERAKYPDYVTVWSKEIFVEKGDRISVKGWLSWKKSERDGKVYVDVSVNQPKVEKHEKAAPAVSSDVPF